MASNKLHFESTDQYYLDPELGAIVNIAMEMEKPLLITGEAGTGKTQLGFQVARSLGMDIEVMIVGHGAPMHGKEVIEDWIRWVLGYLRGLRREIRTRLDRDEAPEEIADALTFEQWVGDRLPADKFGMPKRHRTAVEKIIKEEAAVR